MPGASSSLVNSNSNFSNGFNPLNFQRAPVTNSQTLSQEAVNNLEVKFCNQLSMMNGMGFTVFFEISV